MQSRAYLLDLGIVTRCFVLGGKRWGMKAKIFSDSHELQPNCSYREDLEAYDDQLVMRRNCWGGKFSSGSGSLPLSVSCTIRWSLDEIHWNWNARTCETPSLDGTQKPLGTSTFLKGYSTTIAIAIFWRWESITLYYSSRAKAICDVTEKVREFSCTMWRQKYSELRVHMKRN